MSKLYVKYVNQQKNLYYFTEKATLKDDVVLVF